VAQTFSAWEIIIVDDGSIDDTLNVAQQLVVQYADRHIRVLQQPNRGLSAARNTGTRYAAGEFVMYLDADDLLAPTYLERTTAVLRGQPLVGFVYSGIRLFGHDEHVWPSVAFDLRTLMVENFVLSHSVLRRMAWEQVGGFDTVHCLYGLEDWDFWLRLAAAGWRGWHIEELLVFYRKHGRSMSDSLRLDQEWDARAEIIRKHPDLYGRRLAAWATVRCARHGRLHPARPALCDRDVRDLTVTDRVPPNTVTPALPPVEVGRISFGRRLIRAVPFRLRFPVKCALRRVQLALRASCPWLYVGWT
jgi:glycosyltransferase involved in cell wall biosynthesis